ncbi:DhnA-type fructose-1,6-bisphosphate aldolase-like enzyme [Sphaerochaeta pleomorpha str. Grapes]|uniref:DhnA-type fructose-1,6-bisphosphate aldolase-like enzyme n=1 Tax=Sphaerochaeta pleomorpha (strain ATCC BAA-1885 / DSM 22778 / Grapes) TaxID=158190 RepID=G8QTR5_SPHPG|nr:fructose-bisphosphate aldolase [Sphaerochaeta pleomorpha]AEV28030.1 DhnA-type fructose-1,6-bisphosphate aldolase-like enzyme [Sphaerochaeta pleomorpha str. Grapes]
MQSGLELRKHAVFAKRDGNAMIVAMDHGSIAGPLDGLISPSSLVRTCVKANVDGILATKGFLDASVSEWDRSTSLVLRLTGGFTVLGGGFEEELIVEAETALACGASCAAITIKFGHEREGKFIRQASLAIDQCHRLGLLVMVEALACGKIKGKTFPANDGEAIRMVARMGAELGADCIKTHYTGNKESFASVVEGCPVPILILGGEKGRPLQFVFQDIYDSLQAGGRGIAMGRNIWQQKDLPGMLSCVNGLVHEKWSVSEALQRMGENP